MIRVFCLNWNGEHLLQKMLPGLIENLNKTKQEYKIHIRDNGSRDQSINVIGEYKVIDLMSIDHNRASYSEGINSLFLAANPDKDDTLLLLNNDIQFNDDISLRNMYRLIEKTNAAVCGTKLLYPNKTISHNGVIFSPKYGLMPWHFQVGELITDNKSRYFQAVTAACSFVKVGNFQKAGMLDQNLRWAFEDVALNLEISINQKEKVVCCGDTNITHLTSNSLDKNPVNKMFLNSNVKYFKEKWFGKYEIDHEKYLSNKNYNVVE